jgi:hypothetical protein
MGCLARALLDMVRKSVFSTFGLVRKALFLLFLVSFSLTQMYGFVVIGIITIILVLLTLFRAGITISTSDVSTYFFGFFLLIGIYGLCLGAFFGIDYSVIILQSKVFIFYPIIGFFIALLVKRVYFSTFIRNIVLASVCMVITLNCMAGIDYYFGSGFFSSNFMNRGMFSFSFYEGRFILNALNIASIPLLFPFLAFYALYDKKASGDLNRSKNNRLFSYILLVLLVLVILFSGRRGVWMTSALSIFFLYMMCSRSSHFGKVILQLFAISGLMLGLLFYFDIFSFYVSEIESQSVRSIQSKVLIEAFYDSPLGNGIGSSFAVVRSDNAWVYELTWHKLLADVGILLPLGFFCFLGLTVKILRGNRNILSRKDYNFCSSAAVALGATLLASATNPYILNLDGFIGLGFIFGVFDGVRSRSRVANSVPISQRALIGTSVRV